MLNLSFRKSVNQQKVNYYKNQRVWNKSLTLNIKSEQNELSHTQNSVLFAFLSNLSIFKIYNKEFLKSKSFCPRLFGKTVEFQKLLQILNFTYHFNDLDCLHFILICFTVISRRKSSPLFKNFSKVRIIIIPYLTRYL